MKYFVHTNWLALWALALVVLKVVLNLKGAAKVRVFAFIDAAIDYVVPPRNRYE